MSEKTMEKPPADALTAEREAEAEEKAAARQASLLKDGWADLRKRPMFLVTAFIIVCLLALAIMPGLFTARSPFSDGFCQLQNSMDGPTSGHLFGFDVQGCDIYTRTVYGARNSVVVGVVTTIATTLIGGLVGMLAGLAGGWIDALLSRITEVFSGLPLIIGGLLIMSIWRTGDVWSVSVIMAILGWPQVFRIMRGEVISNKYNDYVMAARALGAGSWRMAFRHILPNTLAPVIVITTMNLGVYIAAEAALSYLGIGIQYPNISWGLMISDAQDRFLTSPHALLFPAGALSITVLAFIMLGDVVRDAFDPKMR
ncbi:MULTISPECIES: ABC transporter permease [Streptomyces]|uniref:ABC transporter permease n=1 Tax=Streptomyces nodosus TaxID=40318 RepID=A0A0B5DGJ9_9ACTN|nr:MULTISPECIES: ABC transporter permease [Streptomyces]AJE42334.1 peptide ABC transporter permease [Streptomyces nodosus]MBB4793624.1 oligopeptide transport system permease protein [Streptomyces nodosus]MYV44566.1 ABC transporter permease subunit [Streptomyces sp. SID2888]QEV40853.1 ABC transporter permease [Streptomyces nodosus]